MDLKEDVHYPLSTCPSWVTNNSIVFQLSCGLLTLGFLIPHRGVLTSFVAHLLIALGHIIFSLWGVVFVCSPDILGWNLLFALLHFVHIGYFAWRLRPVFLSRELKDLYQVVFKPFAVSKREFRNLSQMGKIYTLKNGECYAEEGKTSTGNLSIILYGKVKVYCGGEYLHHILDKQFLDSPEWDAYDSNNQAEKFQVTLKATSYCKYLMWERETLQEYLDSDSFMKQIFINLIGHDVARKLTLLTERQWGHVGIKPDIRLSALEADTEHK
ncbi:Blood vessel epicardial substance [Holothuria leucospilota]|uniref:Blood vessel epicardial substance n=1 Tax=Holothuria leucospilota TaxID=206669 RepID=A0A9Q0YTF8_HOLLE|nr:Blood vessel epicardial substance [Holothuria leucospilota]